MWLSLTGTPGTGKTAVADVLRERGHRVVDLNRLVKEHDLVLGRDEERETDIADIDAISKLLERELRILDLED